MLIQQGILLIKGLHLHIIRVEENWLLGKQEKQETTYSSKVKYRSSV